MTTLDIDSVRLFHLPVRNKYWDCSQNECDWDGCSDAAEDGHVVHEGGDEKDEGPVAEVDKEEREAEQLIKNEYEYE